MKRFTAIALAVFFAVFAVTMIVKSNQEWDNNADGLIKSLTPDALISRCGQPAADIVSGSTINNRRMFYATSRDKSIGMIFSFHRTPHNPGWDYLSFHLGTQQGGGVLEMENVMGSNSWAVIQLPCLQPARSASAALRLPK